MKWFETVLAAQVPHVNTDLNKMRPLVPVNEGLKIVNTTIVKTAEEAWLALERFDGKGWVTTIDEVIQIWTGQRNEFYPLWAELVNGHKSLTLRCDGEQWRTDEIHRIEDSKQRLFTEYFARRPVGQMHYEIAWHLEDGRWQPWLSRLSKVTDSPYPDSD